MPTQREKLTPQDVKDFISSESLGEVSSTKNDQETYKLSLLKDLKSFESKKACVLYHDLLLDFDSLEPQSISLAMDAIDKILFAQDLGKEDVLPKTKEARDQLRFLYEQKVKRDHNVESAEEAVMPVKYHPHTMPLWLRVFNWLTLPFNRH